MSKQEQEIEDFKKEVKEELLNEIKRQNFWIKFNTVLVLAFVCGLGVCFKLVYDVKKDYLSKSEYEQRNTEFTQEIAEKYGLNIQLANVRTQQIRAVLIEKDLVKYNRLLADEDNLLREQAAISLTIKRRGK